MHGNAVGVLTHGDINMTSQRCPAPVPLPDVEPTVLPPSRFPTLKGVRASLKGTLSGTPSTACSPADDSVPPVVEVPTDWLLLLPACLVALVQPWALPAAPAVTAAKGSNSEVGQCTAK